MVNRWARQYKQLGEAAFSRNNISNHHAVGFSDTDYHTLKHENERLKKLLGEKDLEIAILRDLLKK